MFESTVSTLLIEQNGLDGNNVAFRYTLVNGRSGVAVASLNAVVIPEAGTFALVLPALGMVGAVVIRRRKKE